MDAPITDAMRWRYMTENGRNAAGFQHLLGLLSQGKGNMASFVTMTDRIIRSAQAAGHTTVTTDDLLEACRAIEAHCQVVTTPHGDPVAHAEEGKRLRKQLQSAIAKAETQP